MKYREGNGVNAKDEIQIRDLEKEEKRNKIEERCVAKETF